MKDLVTVKDRLELRHGGRQVVAGEMPEKTPVLIEGFFSCVCRERGKLVPGTRREGKNIWTLTGREYLARLMSYAAYGIPPVADTPARNDRIRYIGFGIGVTPEVSSVSRLVSPIAYDNSSGGLFLAELAIPTYPFQTTGSYGTSVRYTREFSETELSVSTTVLLTEAGLFTDGNPNSSPIPFTPGTRDVSLSEAINQAPAGYKSFEPLKKTQNFVLQTAWEVRF
jgi:hypothetical protein